jgi:hypothetical protein
MKSTTRDDILNIGYPACCVLYYGMQLFHVTKTALNLDIFMRSLFLP